MAKTDLVRIIPHEAVPKTGSFEVRYPGGSLFFYWDDIPGRRLRPEALTRAQALAQARAFAKQKAGPPSS